MKMSRLNIYSLIIVVMNLDHLIWWCSWRCIFQTGVWVCKNFLLRGELVNHWLDHNEETYGSCLAVICKGPYWRWIHLCDHDHCGRYHYGDRLSAHDWLIECNWNLYVNYEVSCLLYDKTTYPVCLSFVYRFSFGFGKMRSWIGHHVFDVCDLECHLYWHKNEVHIGSCLAVICKGQYWRWMNTISKHDKLDPSGQWIAPGAEWRLHWAPCVCMQSYELDPSLGSTWWNESSIWCERIHIGLCDLYWEEAHTVLWPFVLVPTMWKNGHVEQVEFDLCS